MEIHGALPAAVRIPVHYAIMVAHFLCEWENARDVSIFDLHMVRDGLLNGDGKFDGITNVYVMMLGLPSFLACIPL